MTLDNKIIPREELPENFANFFQGKVENLANTCNIDQNIYNGGKIIEATNENFMTELNILQILKTLKIKKLRRL